LSLPHKVSFTIVGGEITELDIRRLLRSKASPCGMFLRLNVNILFFLCQLLFQQSFICFHHSSMSATTGPLAAVATWDSVLKHPYKTNHILLH